MTLGLDQWGKGTSGVQLNCCARGCLGELGFSALDEQRIAGEPVKESIVWEAVKGTCETPRSVGAWVRPAAPWWGTPSLRSRLPEGPCVLHMGACPASSKVL